MLVRFDASRAVRSRWLPVALVSTRPPGEASTSLILSLALSNSSCPVPVSSVSGLTTFCATISSRRRRRLCSCLTVLCLRAPFSSILHHPTSSTSPFRRVALRYHLHTQSARLPRRRLTFGFLIAVARRPSPHRTPVRPCLLSLTLHQ